jgi:two-component system LytT family response regulator
MPPPDLGLINAVPLLAGTHRTPRVAGETPAPPNEKADGWLTRIAVRSLGRIVIVPVHEIVRLEAEDNYVRIWADRPYLHKDTLSGLCARLDPAEFLRVHRSHALNLRLVRELHPQLHGEFRISLANGTEITSGRSYRAAIQRAFGLGKATLE